MLGDGAIPVVRIFISSPSDVGEERAVALAVIRRLQGHFQGRLRLIPVLWEQEPLLATAGFQEEIDRRIAPSLADVALFILWSRLGTPLSERFALEDGRRPGGTEWEFTEAARAAKERGSPHVLVYRKSAEALVSLTRNDDAARRERAEQYDALAAFFEQHFRDAEHLAFTGSYHRFENASAFAQLLDTHLSKVLAERLEGTASRTITWHGPPFRGLEPFDAEHAPVFFGRTRAIHEVRQALARQVRDRRAFVLILGPSGNGKSSLVRAGLLPLLTGPWVVEDGVQGGFCRTAVLRPAEARTPLEALARALLAPQALPDLASSGGAPELAAALAEGPRAVVALVRGALAREAARLATAQRLDAAPPGRLLVLVDQFEEVFTHAGVGPDEREAFAGVLDALARSGLAWVLATLRSDFYPAFASSPRLMALKEGAGHYDLLPPDAAEVAQAIRGPAVAAGLRYEVRAADRKGLDDLLVEAGTRGSDALPLLEFLLTQLWERRRGSLLTFEAYESLGGLEGALATHAESTWRTLTASVQGAFPGLVRALVEVGEGAEASATRRRAPYREVAATAEARALVDALVAARLLVADGAGDDAVVSVAHEALLRAWPRLAERLTAEAELLRIRSRLRTQAARWAGTGEDTSLLLAGGRPLGEAQLLTASGFSLSPGETRYVRASERRSSRARWVRRGAVLLIGALAVVASVMALSAQQALTTSEALRAAASLDSRRIMSLNALRALRVAVEQLYPDSLANVQAAEEVLDAAQEVIARRPHFEAELHELVERGTPPWPDSPSEYGGWTFQDDKDAVLHRVLAEIVSESRAAAQPLPEGLMARLRARFAPVRANDLPSVYPDPDVDVVLPITAPYGELNIIPPQGFVYLGVDPSSQLLEFAHVASGTVPGRDASGHLLLTEDSCLVFVLLPGGTYRRGAQSPLDVRGGVTPAEELPAHDVTVSPFLLSKYECTQAQWARLSEGSWPSEAEFRRLKDVTPLHPVEHVSWEDCMGRPGWLRRFGLRLPTEAEWEFAARCPLDSEGRRADRPEAYPWGDDGAQAWKRAALQSVEGTPTPKRPHTIPVGSYPPNRFGLHDMSGNVREWCLDWFAAWYYERLAALASPSTDPQGPAREDLTGVSHRVMRGGCWLHDAGEARSAFRTRGAPTLNFGYIGCRPAQSVQLRPPPAGRR